MTNLNIDELDPSGDVRQIADDAGAYDPTGTRRRDLIATAGTAGVGIFGLNALLSPLDAFAAATSSQKGKWSTAASKSIRRGKINANDVKIGNYALTLEYLEAAFYAAAAAAKYPDADIATAANILAAHEAAHVKALKKVLGSAAVKAPKLDMAGVAKALVDGPTFIATAAGIEPVGTSAYAGAGPYVQNKGIVQAALSIHSVEANHASYTATICQFKGITTSPVTGAVPSPVAHTFNPPRTFDQVITQVGKLGFLGSGPLQPS